MPIILKKNICIELANKYKGWYSFVQSHKVRFSSTNDERMWGCEENLYGIWSLYLIKTNQGYLHLLNKFNKNVLIEQPWCPNFESEIKKHDPLFVNFNDSEITNKKESITHLMSKLTEKYKIDPSFIYSVM